MAASLLFFYCNSALVILAIALARWSFRDRPVWHQAVAAIMAFVAVSTGLTLVLGLARILSPWIVALVLTLLLPVAVQLFRSSPQPQVEQERLPALELPIVSWALIVATLGTIGGFWFIRGVLVVRHMKFDDYAYHAAIVSRWLTDGGIYLTPIINDYYPHNAELLSLWFLHPLRHDGFAGMTGLTYAALIALSAHGYIRRHHHSLHWSALLAPAVILSSPVLLREGGSFSATDLAGPAMILSSVLMLVSAQEGEWRSRVSCCIWSIVGAGFAIGTKVTFLPLSAVVILVAGAQLLKLARRQVWIGVLIFLVASVLLAQNYWYLRNIVETGNPVYPAAAGPFEGPRGTLSRTTLLNFLVTYPDAEHWQQAARVHFSWPYSYAALSAFGFLWAALYALRRGRDIAGRRKNQFLWEGLLPGLGVLAALQYVFTPYSAGPLGRVGEIHLANARYVIFVFVVGIVLLAIGMGHIAPRSRSGNVVLSAVSAICVMAHAFLLTRELRPWMHPGSTRLGSLCIGIGVSLTVCLILLLSARVRWRRYSTVGVTLIVCIAGCFALSMLAPLKARQADEYEFGRGRRGWLVRQIEDLPSGSRLAAVGIGRREYILAGRRFQHRPVYVSENGRRRLPEHQRSLASEASQTNTVLNLLASGVDYVLVGGWGESNGVVSPRMEEELKKSEESCLVSSKRGVGEVWGLGDRCRDVVEPRRRSARPRR